MEIEKEKNKDLLIYRLSGKIDSNSSTDFEKDIFESINSGVAKILIELGKVSYISSAGLRVFLVSAKMLRTKSGIISFCNLNETTKNILEISGFSGIFKIYETETEAVTDITNKRVH